jgi:hypothetical protein
MPRRTYSHATRPRPVPGGVITLDRLQAGDGSPTPPTASTAVPRQRSKPKATVVARTARGGLWDVAAATDGDLAACLPSALRTEAHVAFARVQDYRLLTALTSKPRVAVLFARDHLTAHPHRDDAAAYDNAAGDLTTRAVAAIDRALIDRRLPA